MSESGQGKSGRHLAAAEAILDRDEITLTPDNVVNLLAYLQSTKTFQNHAIRALASMAAGQANWESIDQLVADAELSDKILERLIAKLSGQESVQ